MVNRYGGGALGEWDGGFFRLVAWSGRKIHEEDDENEEEGKGGEGGGKVIDRINRRLGSDGKACLLHDACSRHMYEI